MQVRSVSKCRSVSGTEKAALNFSCLSDLYFKRSFHPINGFLSAAILLLLTNLQPVSSAQTAWTKFLEDATKLRQEAKNSEAIKAYEFALKDIDSTDSTEEQDPQKVLILLPLADLLSNEKTRASEAEAMYRRALLICESAYGPDDANVGAILARLASLATEQRRLSEAESLLSRAISISEKTLKSDDPKLAQLRIQLGALYFRLHKSSLALEQFNQAEQAFEKAYGQSDGNVADALEFQSLVYRQLHEFTRAERLLDQVIAINEKNGAEQKLAASLESLGTVYVSQGKYSEAQAPLQKALALTEKIHGACSKNFAIVLESQALLETSMGNYARAQRHAKEALSIFEEKNGKDSPLLLSSLRILASSYLLEQRDEDAVITLERMLVLQQKTSGLSTPELSFTLNKLAEIEMRRKNFQRAEELYRKSLAKDVKAYGDDSPIVASDQSNLAAALEAQGKNPEATELRASALMIKKNIAGSEKLKSNPAKVQIGTESTTHNQPVGSKWALLIGISQFKDPSQNLQFAAKDAQDFRNFLVKEANFSPDHVKLLTDAQATRANIVSALGTGWLGPRVKSDDLVIVYVSSHASEEANEAKKTNFVLAYDTNESNVLLNGIPMQWLTAGVSKLVKSNRVIVVLDVCHAGAAELEQPNSLRPDKVKLPSTGTGEGKGLKRVGANRAIRDFSVDNVSLGKGQILIASSDADQTSYESKNYRNGVFTHYLIEGLRLHGANTTLSDACNYMNQKVEDEVLRDRQQLQTPVVRHQWKGPDVVLGAKIDGSN